MTLAITGPYGTNALEYYPLVALFLVLSFGALAVMLGAPESLISARAERQVRKMGRRAKLRRADGGRGPRARRALRVLARRARDQNGYSAFAARLALWRVWLAGPDDQVWELLDKSYRDLVVAAAMDPGQPETARRAIGAFVAARGLAPQEASQRALFFVLTGQRAQHRSEDPDGTLLAAAYRAARAEQRAAVRQALTGADDLDLVRVVAGAGRDAAAPVSLEEVSYLAGQLAGRRDWSGLWQFALSLPLAGAVTAASGFGDGWQPDDDAGQALLRQLAAADAGQIILAIGHVRSTGRSTDAPDPVAELLGRPLALLTSADLGTVASLLLAHPSGPLELLAACLQYRFGSEIALGTQVSVPPGSTDDVALAPGPAAQQPAQA